MTVIAFFAVSCEKPVPPVSVSGITLSTESLNLTEGESAMLTATPSNADNKAVIWSSSNASVATVNEGTVIVISEGTAIITAKSDDGGKTATCSISVSKKLIEVESITLEFQQGKN